MTTRQTDISAQNINTYDSEANNTNVSRIKDKQISLSIHQSDRDKSHLRLSLKQSKLTEKPQFKSRKKANPRLCLQTNKISNYFTANSAAVGRGISGTESENKLNDLTHKFSSARTKRQPLT